MDNDGWNQNSLNVLNNISAPEPWDSPPLIFSLEDKDGNPIQFDLSSALKQSVRGKSKKTSFKRSILQSAIFFSMSTFDNMSSTETKNITGHGCLYQISIKDEQINNNNSSGFIHCTSTTAG